MKYPHVEDYAVRLSELLLQTSPDSFRRQLSLKEHDEKQLYIARQNLHDLRSIYAILTDILHKNIDKVRGVV